MEMHSRSLSRAKPVRANVLYGSHSPLVWLSDLVVPDCGKYMLRMALVTSELSTYIQRNNLVKVARRPLGIYFPFIDLTGKAAHGVWLSVSTQQHDARGRREAFKGQTKRLRNLSWSELHCSSLSAAIRQPAADLRVRAPRNLSLGSGDSNSKGSIAF